ncbi:MAG: sigma-70 family RNA polymerase sigma factor, partial [Tepidiformaceae bacterium]
MDELSDSALVELAKSGEASAFAQLYARHFSALYDFAIRLTRDRDETEAIARDAFSVAMDALAGLHRGVSFRAWLFAITRKHTLDTLAQQDHPAPPFLANEADALHQIDTTRLASPAEDTEAAALAPLVWRAAAALDPKQLSLLDLHLRLDLGVNEIADVMGVNRRNSEVMLTRLKATTADTMAAFIVREEPVASDVPPLAVFAAFAEVPAPDGLADEILGDLMRHWPGAVAAVPAFTAPIAAGAAGKRFLDGHGLGQLFGALGVAAVLLLALLLVPASPIALTRGDAQPLVQAQSDSPTAGISATRANNAAASTTATQTKTTSGAGPFSPTPTTLTPTITTDAQVAGGPSATSTPTPVSSATATSTPSPIPSPTSPPPTPIPTATGTAVPCRPAIGTASITDLTVALGGTSNFPLFNQAFCAN